MPPRRALPAVPFALLALAAPAGAASVSVGPDLSAAGDATVYGNDGNDWVAWNAGDLFRSPVQGEVDVVNLKGYMQLEGRERLPPKPDVVMHVMVLRPQGDGSVAVPAGGVSENLPLPLEQDPSKVHTYTRTELTRPDGPDGKGGTRLCIRKGDYLAFTTSGGFGGNADQNPEQIYTDGAKFQVFARSPTITTDYFERGGAFTESAFVAKPFPNEQLLMNATIGTGADARYTCRTDAEKAQNLDNPKAPRPTSDVYAPPPAPVARAALVKPRTAPKVKRNRVSLVVTCSAAGACGGTLGLRTYARAKAFALAAGQTGKVTLTVNRKARRKLKRKGARLTVKAMLRSSDGSSQSLRLKLKRA